MYCPIDGDEFREGITRCPEHDVALVENPPDLEEPLSWIDRFNDRTAVRLSFAVFIVAAVIYALAGFITALIYLLIQLRDWEAGETAQVFQEIQFAANPIGIAALGVLAGALLLRTYLLFSETGRVAVRSSDLADPQVSDGPIPPALMRLLFALSVVFALLWAGTGIATSRERVEFRSSPFGFGLNEERPDDSFITLSTINLVAHTGGVASLAIMGAGLIARAHERGRRRPD